MDQMSGEESRQDAIEYFREAGERYTQAVIKAGYSDDHVRDWLQKRYVERVKRKPGVEYLVKTYQQAGMAEEEIHARLAAQYKAPMLIRMDSLLTDIEALWKLDGISEVGAESLRRLTDRYFALRMLAFREFLVGQEQ